MNNKEMKKITKEIEELLIRKNKTYGEENITKIGKLGILTRLEEKIERLKHMVKNNIDDEDSRDDNWKDIAGYAILGEMLERGKWTK